MLFQASMGDSVVKRIQLNTEFQNVDLDIFSAQDLTLLVNALGDKIILLHLGRHKRTWEAHLELASHPTRNPNSAISNFCKLIRALPAEARQLWDCAKIRQFHIGISAGTDQPAYWSSIDAETIKLAAELNASIAITIYPAHQEIGERAIPEGSNS